MNKNSIILITLILLSVNSCKSDKDILASFKGGQITRGDFNAWLDFRKLSKESILKKKSNQKIKLKQIAIDKLTYMEAIKAGYDKKENTKELLSLIKDNFLTGFFIKKVRTSLSFSEKAVKVKIIKFNIKNYKIVKNKRVNLTKDEIESQLKKKMDIAKSVIDKLNNNAQFANLAKEYSEDPSKNRGGSIGYIIRGMREPELVNKAFSLKAGEYTKTPLRIRNSIYIILTEDKTKITDKNIDSVISDKRKSAMLKRRLKTNAARALENKLLKSNDVKSMIGNANFNDPDEVLFKIGSNEFKVSDFDRIIDISYRMRPGLNRRQNDLTERRKKQLASRIFRQKLLLKEAYKRGIHKDPEFLRDWKFAGEYSLANAYKNDVIMSDIKVTDNEVKAEYDRNKKRAYTRRIKKGNKTEKKVLPFKDVKDRIRYMLFNRKRSKKRQTWEKELLKKNDFKINENMLSGE